MSVMCTMCESLSEAEETLVAGCTAFSRVPSTWTVVDVYPPDDGGLALLCSAACVEKWATEREDSR